MRRLLAWILDRPYDPPQMCVACGCEQTRRHKCNAY